MDSVEVSTSSGRIDLTGATAPVDIQTTTGWTTGTSLQGDITVEPA
ncbi:hypothetical protein OG897_34215 [Streptomyces sp. NBC_00237]|nr:hypothetical protein [Streptomyces sp. NBC_00237]MCX5206450.1 hypothetical protein [Streptomyces sp. NBC_00237]